MGYTIAQKIIRSHLVSGEMIPGAEIGLRIDQTLTQDATGTMAYLALEAMDVPRVRTELSVAYIDHNTLQCGFENADDHRYIQSVARKYGVRFSRPGNGICHQVHLERFGKPGKTLIGSDSHTPTGGALGMLALGAGGMDVAVAMAGGAYYINMPRMFKVNLTGRLQPWVSAKDVSLEILRILSVRGGRGAVIEWGGEGVKTLSVPERATIANMGTELGATSSIFPSDEITESFLRAQGREADYIPLASDPDAVYDRVIDIDLSAVEPLCACPHSPDNVRPARELEDVAVSQVCIGSCTNSSLRDLLRVAAILRGRKVADGVSLSVSPGSRQVLEMLSGCGALTPAAPACWSAPAGRASAWASPPPRAACPCARSTATLKAAAARATRRSTSSRRRSPPPRRSAATSPIPAVWANAPRSSCRSASGSTTAACCRRQMRPRRQASRSCAARTSARCRWANRSARRSPRR